MKTKSLIAYFSRAGFNYMDGNIVNLEVGNVQNMAMEIQKIIQGDIFKIEPVKPYPITYQETVTVCKQEYEQKARPQLINALASIAEYDTIYLGFPNWWGTMPMIVWTFLEAYDFSNKIIIPFCSHEGSGLGNSVGDIKKLCPNSVVENGLAIRGSMVPNAKERIVDWLQK